MLTEVPAGLNNCGQVNGLVMTLEYQLAQDHKSY